jgi:hypothetical protein
MEKLLEAIADAISEAAKREPHLPDWVPDHEIKEMRIIIARIEEMLEMGRPLDEVLELIEKDRRAAWAALDRVKDPAAFEHNSAGRYLPGRFIAKCHAVCMPIIADYLKGRGKPSGGEEPGEAQLVAFEALFHSPDVAALVIRAMQGASPRPLLNEQGANILRGKKRVAPIVALVHTILHRELAAPGIGFDEAYRAICAHFGFHVSERPEKATEQGRNTYDDYAKSFDDFFKWNKPS